MNFLLALFLAVSAAAQEQIQSQSDFTGGLNTQRAGILLNDNESPALQNVILDKSDAISRRKGFSRRNSTAIGTGNDDVNAVYGLNRSNGTRYCVAFSSTNGYLSTDDCQTFSSFVSTLTYDNDVSCAAYGDNLYCVNNQYNFLFNGTDDSPVSAMPANLDYIQVHRNRCFAAGNDTNPSRLFWSNLGNCGAWTTATDYVDLDAEDGDSITGIGEPIFGMLPIYKRFSTWVLKGTTPADWFLLNVSKNVGALNHRSIRNLLINGQTAQLFDSVGPFGGQPGIYAFDGANIVEASKKLRGELDQAAPFASRAGRRSIDSKAEWEQATFSTAALSVTRDPGFMQSSYTSRTDTSVQDFNGGILVSVSTTDPVGTVVMSSSVFQDDFDDGNFTGGLAAWTQTADGGWEVQDRELRCLLGGNEINAAMKISSGSYKWSFRQYNLGTTARTKFISADNTFSSNGYFLESNRPSSGEGFTNVRIKRWPADVVVCSSSSLTYNDGVKITFEVRRSTSGEFTVFKDSELVCTGTDTNFNTTANVILQCGSANSAQWDDLYFYSYGTSGTFTSSAMDTAITTPTWGPFTANITSSTANTITFRVQSSTYATAGWQALQSQTNGSINAAAASRFVRYEAVFGTSEPWRTASIADITMSAGSTGTWSSNELFLTSSMTAWGLFQVQQTLTGAGSAAYAMRISTFAGGTTSTGTIVVTNGSLVAHSTGAYVVVIATYTIGSASDTAKTDAIILNWTEGKKAKSASAAVFQNRYHYGTQSSTATQNDVIYVLDSNGAWVKWTGVLPRYLNNISQRFLMASSSQSSAGYIYQLYDTEADDGVAINAFWESKDIYFGKVHDLKAVDRIVVIGSNDPTVLTVTLKTDGALSSKDYSVDLSTGGRYAVRMLSTEKAINGRTFRLRIANNAVSKPWEIYGLGLSWKDLGLIQP